MNHAHAIAVFEEIRARPYRVSEAVGVAANNCYFKGVELLQRLGTLGYPVRGRVGRMEWDAKIIPGEILALSHLNFLRPISMSRPRSMANGARSTLASSQSLPSMACQSANGRLAIPV